MKELIIIFFGLIISVVLNIAVMIKGWGLEAHSWWWIIGAGIFTQLFVQIIVAAGKSHD